MLLKELKGNYTKEKCFKWGANNAVKIGYNNMMKVFDNIYIGEFCTEFDETRASLYFKVDDFPALEIVNNNKIDGLTVDFTQEWMVKNGYSEKDYKNTLLKTAQNGGWINNMQIEFSKCSYPEITKELITARQNYIDKREQKRQEERQAREQKAQEDYNRTVKEFDEKIELVEREILAKNKINNDEIETPDGAETTVILYLAKKYGVKIPLRTQGWINKALAFIEYNGEKWGYSYYTRSKNSTVFRDYLAELVLAINKAYNSEPAVTEELEKAITEQQAEAEQVKQIESLNFSEVRGFNNQVEINKALRAKENILEGEQLQIYAILYKAIRSKQPMQDAEKRIEHAKIFHDDITTGEISLNYGKNNTIKAIKSQGQYIFIRDNNKGRTWAKLPITAR